MANEETKVEYSFTIRRINLLEKTLITGRPISNQEEFDFDVSLQIGNNLDSKEIVYIMEVIVSSKRAKVKIASIKLGCTFYIPNIETFFIDREINSEVNTPLPQDLIYLLNTVVIGTMRGVMFSEFRGTVLNSAYLPVLDPRQFQKT